MFNLLCIIFFCLRFDFTLCKVLNGKSLEILSKFMYIQIFSLEFDIEWAWVVSTLLSDGLGWTWIYDNLLLLAQIFCLTVAHLSVNNKNKKLVPLASSPFPCSVLPLNFSIFFSKFQLFSPYLYQNS